MADLQESQKQLGTLRAQRDAAAAEARSLSLRARGMRSKLAERQRFDPQFEGAGQIEEQIAAVERDAAVRRERVTGLESKLVDGIAELLQPSIEELVPRLDDHVPVLMLPVRLETKYAQGRDGVELRVRIFPDDIHISAHDPLLSAGERTAGETYWVERARAAALDAGERRIAEEGAWSLLATRYGGPRARFIARTTKPAEGGPAAELVRDAESGVPARARLLPDFFVVRALDAAGNVIAQHSGRLISDSLQIGLDPDSPASSLTRDADGRLAADPKLSWLISYEAAVAAGMAVTLALPGRVPIARLIAIGLRLSMTPAAGAAALEELFSDHRFTDGIDVVRQGSPTNNTDGAASAFTTDLSADEALVEQEIHGRVAVAVLDHAQKSDGQRLAEALGVSFEAVRDWPNASATDGADALAMNRALWPATFGTYLRELVGAHLSNTVKAETERFFETYVTGRGLLPAIRVGAQPYGVLATSDLRRWTESDADDDSPAFRTIVDGLNWFRERFERLETSIAQMGRGGNALAMTMRVIGQTASSVTFRSRKAVTDEASWNTLRFTNTIPAIQSQWFTTVTKAKNDRFTELGIDKTRLPLADLTFFGAADALAVPVVDRDPGVPLSERDGIARFDGMRNYIDWLLTASAADLRGEVFRNSVGDVIPPPEALLYRFLYHAWTASVVRTSSAILSRLRPDAVVQQDDSLSFQNLGRDKVLPESHVSNVDAAAIGLTQNSRILGDYVLDIGRSAIVTVDTPPEALPLQSQREAIARLAPLPTAVLERLFAEHVDLASYRLDAWLTALVARRLDFMRRRPRRDRGIYLGAYGYVENLVPKAAPAAVNQETLPPSLREPNKTITEQERNGGFVQAPSLMHGVTAAVLRNAYLTHADQTLRDSMSVNLTSRRVRAAMSFIEGIRAGQELAALLGYQLERGLHERHPNIELDAFIYVLRARFPLVSRRLTPVADGTPAEQIEARNVIDGYDLLRHVRGKTYPYDIAGLPAAGTAAAGAIAEEIERLDDTLDSISDLMTAESVHQAVQSNIDRARGALASVTDGQMPPVPDVVGTPRSGRVITQRVALHLPPAAAAWTNPLTPRALANQRLNAWLAAQLPAPNQIGYEIRQSAGGTVPLTIDSSGLDAIDVVLMSADRFGDGSSELERFLADRWRGANAIGDDVLTLFTTPAPGAAAQHIVLDAAGGAATVSLAKLLPQLRALRRTIGASRGLNAQDYRLPSDIEKAPKENPKGLALDGGGDLAALPARIAAARDALAAENDALKTALDGIEPAYKTTVADPSTFNAAVWTNPLLTIRQHLRAIALYGAPEAVPRSAAGVTASSATALYEQGRAVVAAIAKRIETAAGSLAPLPAQAALSDPEQEARRKAARLDLRFDNIREAARQSLGGSYPLQPLFRLGTDERAEVEARLAVPVEDDPLKIEAWLQSLSRVRGRIADLALIAAAAQWTTGSEPRLVPVQLPRRAGDPWVAAQWTAAPAAGDVMSVMTIDAPAALNGDLEGVLLDEWTETVPETKETTGIVFNFDRPSAAAPQSLLLATPPNADGKWQWAEFVGTIEDTFDRARLRAIEPDALNATGLFQLLPATLMSFTELRGFASTFLSRQAMNTTLSRR